MIDPVITVNSPTQVLVDGANFGKVADTIANNRTLASSVQIALEQWHSALIASHTQALADKDTAHGAAIAAKDAEIATLKADHTAALAAAQAQAQTCNEQRAVALAELEQTRAFAAGIITQGKAALEDGALSETERLSMLAGLVSEAAKPAAQRRAEALQREIAAKQKELQELSSAIAQ